MRTLVPTFLKYSGYLRAVGALLHSSHRITSATVCVLVLTPALATADTSTYQEHTFEGGSWRYAMAQNAKPVDCYYTSKQPECITNTLVARNLSNQTLECNGSLRYNGVDDEGFSVVQKPTVLKPQAIRAVLSDVARPNVTIAEYDLVCAARPPIDKSQLTPNCKKNLDTRGIDLKSLYPAASRRESEEGPVVLQFTLTHEAAPPGDIKVVGSSLFPRLDAAAVVALSKAIGSTECERGTYLFEVNFELRD